jgi:hypothetical protein
MRQCMPACRGVRRTTCRDAVGVTAAQQHGTARVRCTRANCVMHHAAWPMRAAAGVWTRLSQWMCRTVRATTQRATRALPANANARSLKCTHTHVRMHATREREKPSLAQEACPHQLVPRLQRCQQRLQAVNLGHVHACASSAARAVVGQTHARAQQVRSLPDTHTRTTLQRLAPGTTVTPGSASSAALLLQQVASTACPRACSSLHNCMHGSQHTHTHTRTHTHTHTRTHTHNGTRGTDMLACVHVHGCVFTVH